MDNTYERYITIIDRRKLKKLYRKKYIIKHKIIHFYMQFFIIYLDCDYVYSKNIFIIRNARDYTGDWYYTIHANSKIFNEYSGFFKDKITYMYMVFETKNDFVKSKLRTC